jgi:TfoX/Sxy family transcriptional regulator of competence genes
MNFWGAVAIGASVGAVFAFLCWLAYRLRSGSSKRLSSYIAADGGQGLLMDFASAQPFEEDQFRLGRYYLFIKNGPVFRLKAMMGEYIIYYRSKIVGGIYDDRFLVKPTQSAKTLMPEANLELPYEGAKEMLLVDDVDNREFLRTLLEAMYDELPAPKKKK